ncbi:Ig-like domain-containing protein [Pseudoalteromonas luteoviolacea]|uniref:Cadherin-like domain-containing protein n=1 Tax=Pseudoalteromonas luteoviolacea H33 TaxID=1365251 RepID=A0A162ADK8_9GAMM|nr:Ig-like domain-containing protein [Pseudoalteromonas luteoviolacea]KZN48043.1 hypothetical protein N476_22625 [Pseudoalteromonas luteoviolacea H33]KZN73825.1 hypothetical protein N477_22985 [Pseudoalteromonas luteoviolacea H33-S]MBQ4878269.1 cadherin-like domain-containing protein [Pseudoalteromonas luteoviolacea]MBQ4907424.1 cadherin-like domain-containing protein [Pseudoalteromonas luteoviolacea]
MSKTTYKALAIALSTGLLSNLVQAAPVLNKTTYEFNSGLQIQEEFNIFGNDNVTDPNYSSNELRIQLNADKSYNQIGFYDQVRTAYGQAVAYNIIDRRWIEFKGKLLYYAAVTDGSNKIETIPFRVINPAGETSEWGVIRVSLDEAFNIDYDYYPSDDNAQTSANQATIINVKDNDANVPYYFGVEVYAWAENGRVTVNDDHTITYTPKAGFVGQDSFRYRIKGNNLYDITSAPATVTINVK